MRKGLILIGLLVALASATLLWGVPKEDLREVVVVQPERRPIESTIRVTGRVDTDRTVALSALIDGSIKELLVARGEQVNKGQTLAVLDQREAEAISSKAEAVLDREREAIKEQIKKLQRLRDVLPAGGATAQLVDDGEAELRTAKARLRIAQEDARIARIRLDKAKVEAPFDGIITEKTAEMGQWVEAGTKLFTLVAQQGWEIEANVDAADSLRVQRGQAVKVSSDAFPGRVWTESVHWIAPAINTNESEAANTFAVRITLGSEAPPLLLGQQVDVKLRVGHRENALKVPYGALIESADGYAVAVLRQGRVHIVPVVTGIEDLTHVEIVSGLMGGEHIILPQGKTLTEGEPVVAVAD